jgi:hypothetical protein
MNMTDISNNMETICNDIGVYLSKFRKNVIAVENVINDNIDKDTKFDDLELVEEKIDELIYNYQFIKDKFKKARNLRYSVEEQQQDQK